MNAEVGIVTLRVDNWKDMLAYYRDKVGLKFLVRAYSGHAHLHGERPAGNIIWRFFQLRVFLRFQQIHQVRAKRLRGD